MKEPDELHVFSGFMLSEVSSILEKLERMTEIIGANIN